MPQRYTLLAAVGLAPASLTEAVWSLYQDRLTPGAVHVLTTEQGRVQLDAELLRGGASSRWSRLCREVLGLEAPLPIEIHVPNRDGEPLDDLRSRADDLAFGDVAYALVRRLTDEDHDPVLIGSIAGGRRTMGAHLTTAFSVCARPQDRLVHVLATPDPQPIAPAYWPGDGGEPLALDRVDIPLPRLRPVLDRDFVERLDDRYDLPNLLDVLAGYNVSETPVAVRVELSQGHPWRSRVVLLAADGSELAEADFTPRMLSIFLLLADATEGARLGAPFGAVAQGVPDGKQDTEAPLVNHAHTAARIAAAYRWCGRTPTAKQQATWTTTEEVSKAISRYHDRRDGLRARAVPPLVQHYLVFDSTPGHRLAGAGGVEHLDVEHWHWATRRALPITVVTPDGVPPTAYPWPHRHIAAPVRIADLGLSGRRS